MLKIDESKVYQFGEVNENNNKIELSKGYYRFELWGSEGGGSSSYSGKGAYVSGLLKLRKWSTFYLYIGGKDGSNGGGIGSTGNGGGSTDIRLINNNELSGLLSRIIVAGGGGSGSQVTNVYKIVSKAGDAGGINGDIGGVEHCNSGTPSNTEIPNGGSQNNGGLGGKCNYHPDNCPSDYKNGTLFFGGDGGYFGGGGGYFGGGGGSYGACAIGLGAGGSSYVSGYKDCKAVNNYKTNTFDDYEMKDNSVHDSGLYFHDIKFLSGNDKTIPKLDGTVETGHSGDGLIRITFISYLDNNSCYYHKISFSLFSLFILIYS